MFKLIHRFVDKLFEPCKGCEVYKIQLELANAEKAELLQTILGLVKPEVIPQQARVVAPVLNKQIPWAFRKRALEEKDREEARIKRDLAIQEQKLNPEIQKLEEELGVEDASEISKTV